MGTVVIKELNKKDRKFDPIHLQINVVIESEEELKEIIDEFNEGDYEHITTQYSKVVWEYIDKLGSFVRNR